MNWNDAADKKEIRRQRAYWRSRAAAFRRKESKLAALGLAADAAYYHEKHERALRWAKEIR